MDRHFTANRQPFIMAHFLFIKYRLRSFISLLFSKEKLQMNRLVNDLKICRV